jgi:hypothetical protein
LFTVSVLCTPYFLSQLEDFKEASASEGIRRTKELATLSTVKSKLILDFPAKDLLRIVCSNNVEMLAAMGHNRMYSKNINT